MEPGKLLEWRQTHYPRLQLTLLNKRWWSRGENQISGADGARLFSQADLVRYASNNERLVQAGGEASKNSSGTAS